MNVDIHCNINWAQFENVKWMYSTHQNHLRFRQSTNVEFWKCSFFSIFSMKLCNRYYNPPLKRFYMKRLETTRTKVMNFFSVVLRAVTTSVSSLLTSTRMFISVGFAIIGVVILGALLDVLVRIHNYRNGTKLQTGQILKGLLISLWNQSVEKVIKNSNSQKNS